MNGLPIEAERRQVAPNTSGKDGEGTNERTRI